MTSKSCFAALLFRKNIFYMKPYDTYIWFLIPLLEKNIYMYSILINLLNIFPFQGWDDLYSNLTSLAFCLNQTVSQDHQDMKSFGYQEYKMVNVSLPFQLTTTPYQGSVAINVSNLAVAIPYFHFKFGRKYSLFVSLL